MRARPRTCPWQNYATHKRNRHLQVNGAQPIVYGYCGQETDCASCAGTLYKPNLLIEQGLIRHPFEFRAVLAWRGARVNIKVGEYDIRGPINPVRLVEMLVAGTPKTYKVTAPEGSTVEKIAPAIPESETQPALTGPLCRL